MGLLWIIRTLLITFFNPASHVVGANEFEGASCSRRAAERYWGAELVPVGASSRHLSDPLFRLTSEYAVFIAADTLTSECFSPAAADETVRNSWDLGNPNNGENLLKTSILGTGKF